MKRVTAIRWGAGALVLACAAIGFWLAPSRAPVPPLVETAERTAPKGRAAVAGRSSNLTPAPAEAAGAEAGPLSAAKAARVAQIKQDYDEVRAKAAADYAAAGKDFPGGLNGFLRQLALLEREKRADYAGILTPRELEDLEIKETTAGQTVQRLLGDSAATEEQRRAVFRQQLAFEDRFALTFDLKPGALLEREIVRREVNDAIRATLGDRLFLQWLRGEGADYTTMVDFATRQGLPEEASIELWRVRNDFNLGRLKINSAGAMPTTQFRAAHGELARQTELRLIGIVGAGTVQLERTGVFGWLGKP